MIGDEVMEHALRFLEANGFPPPTPDQIRVLQAIFGRLGS
jgi:hypothetical protein